VIGSAGGELPPGKKMRGRKPQRRRTRTGPTDRSSAQAMMDRTQRNILSDR